MCVVGGSDARAQCDDNSLQLQPKKRETQKFDSDIHPAKQRTSKKREKEVLSEANFVACREQKKKKKDRDRLAIRARAFVDLNGR